MQDQDWSTCKTSCDDGFTTNGNAGLVCQQCDASCATCADDGLEGDAEDCLTCSPAYNLYDEANNICLKSCPDGQFEKDGLCLPCDANCFTCAGGADVCTSCKAAELTSFSFLVASTCRESCPDRYGTLAGECFPCEGDCDTCSSTPTMCTSCKGVENRDYLWGPTCVSKCPDGFNQNEVTFECEGCPAGCHECEATDNRVCTKCELGLMLTVMLDKEGNPELPTCVSACPPGYLANYEGTACTNLSDIDLTLVYFPFLITAFLMFVLSVVGAKQKKKHLLVPNFLVMMGVLEHLAIITFMVLTLKWGKPAYFVCTLLIWAAFIAINVWFQITFRKEVIDNDKFYQMWRERPENLWSRRLMNALGWVFSWKEYKLTYSGFWGYRIRPARFSAPEVYRALQKKAYFMNTGATYAPLFLVSVVGLIAEPWGTQLYIMCIELPIISIVMVALGWWETKKQESDYLEDKKWNLLPSGSKGFNVMCMLEDEGIPEFSKTKEALLKGIDIDNNEMFVQHKFEELLEQFGGRHAKSMIDLRWDKEEDPRQVRTWPASREVEVEDEPLEALPDPFPDCVYS